MDFDKRAIFFENKHFQRPSAATAFASAKSGFNLESLRSAPTVSLSPVGMPALLSGITPIARPLLKTRALDFLGNGES